MTPTSTIETITPSMARKMLEKNTMNRPVNNDNLDALAKEMVRKNFYLTGESIKIAKDGTLLDGQHRLMAIVKSGLAVKMFIIRGLENDSFKYMDTGRTRQASDVLAIEGVKNATKIAAMVKFVVNFKRGHYSASSAGKTRGKFKLTNADVSEFVAKHKRSLEDSYGFGFAKGRRLISGVVVASLHYIFKAINEREADIFINQLVEGTGLTKESPIFMCREKFILDNRSKRKMPPKEKLALICKAWNLFRTNKKVTILKWDMNKEAFPMPK